MSDQRMNPTLSISLITTDYHFYAICHYLRPWNSTGALTASPIEF